MFNSIEQAKQNIIKLFVRIIPKVNADSNLPGQNYAIGHL